MGKTTFSFLFYEYVEDVRLLYITDANNVVGLDWQGRILVYYQLFFNLRVTRFQHHRWSNYFSGVWDDDTLKHEETFLKLWISVRGNCRKVKKKHHFILTGKNTCQDLGQYKELPDINWGTGKPEKMKTGEESRSGKSSKECHNPCAAVP